MIRWKGLSGTRDAERRDNSDHRDITGEPDAMKVARPVRRGGVGKVLMRMSNSLASYPTARSVRRRLREVISKTLAPFVGERKRLK